MTALGALLKSSRGFCEAAAAAPVECMMTGSVAHGPGFGMCTACCLLHTHQNEQSSRLHSLRHRSCGARHLVHAFCLAGAVTRGRQWVSVGWRVAQGAAISSSKTFKNWHGGITQTSD
jgi:hypothetical protein